MLQRLFEILSGMWLRPRSRLQIAKKSPMFHLFHVNLFFVERADWGMVLNRRASKKNKNCRYGVRKTRRAFQCNKLNPSDPRFSRRPTSVRQASQDASHASHASADGTKRRRRRPRKRAKSPDFPRFPLTVARRLLGRSARRRWRASGG